MIFSGNNNLSLNYQTGLSFYIDLKFNNASGYCELGFSGLNVSATPKEKVSYTFDKSKLYDPENRLIYFYKNDQYVNLSGSINPISYSYYIDGNPLCLNGKKQSFNINKFYLNTSGCTVDANLNILGDIPNYNINLNKFNVSGLLTGTINNNSLSQFRIYSGVVTTPTGFSVNSINIDVLTGSVPSYIVINTLNATKNQIIDDIRYPINLNLYTNFGLISRSYDATGSFIKDLQIILNLNQGFDFDLINSINGINDIKNQEYNLDFYIKSGSNSNLPKNLSLKLEYFGGKTGLFYQNLSATGIENVNLTGLITSGTGILSKVVSFLATGYDPVSGVQQTGTITGIAQGVFFATGFNLNTGYLGATGIFNENIIYKNITFNEGKNIEDGFLNYNKYINSSEYFSNKLITGNTNSNSSLFGHSIAYNNDHSILAISAPSGIIGDRTGAGLVYIFTGNNNWVQSAILSGDDSAANDNFGYSLSMNSGGNVLAVSAPNKILNTSNKAGLVYIFTKSDNTWTSSIKISGNDYSTGDRFGHALQLSKDGLILAVGAPNKNIGSGINTYTGAGSAYLYSNETNNWPQIIKITGTDAKAGDNFGSSISINSNGNVIAIGATGKNIGIMTGLGAVYLFSGDPFSFLWKENIKLTGNNSSSGDCFGYSIAVSNNGNEIFSSSIKNNLNAGHTYSFTGDMFNNFKYKQSQRILPSDIFSGDNFGYSIAINNNQDLLCITSPSDSYSTLTNAGSAYVFAKTNSSWEEKQKITGNINYIQNNNKFGNFACFNGEGSNILISSELFDTGSYTDIGSVFTFKKVDFTGYLGQIAGTGIVSYNALTSATGTMTGSSYNKEFLNVFDLQTGYYTNNQLTGIVSFKTGNLILNQSYMSSGVIDNSINLLYLSIKSKNYPDYEAITGKLTISGYENTNNYNSVIINYITGKR